MKLKMQKSRRNFLKGKAMDRKGMGMELALLVLLVVFACSTLLVTSALVQKENLVGAEDELILHLKLDDMAEYAIENGVDDFTEEFPGYMCVYELSGADHKYEFFEGTEISPLDEAKLIVRVSTSDGKVTKWDYQ